MTFIGKQEFEFKVLWFRFKVVSPLEVNVADELILKTLNIIDDINELNDQLKNVRKQMMEMENNSDGFNFSEFVKLRKEEAEILERLEAMK